MVIGITLGDQEVSTLSWLSFSERAAEGETDIRRRQDVLA